MKVAYATNAGPNSGVGHRAEEIAKRLAPPVELERWHLDGTAGELLHNGQIIAQITKWPGIWGNKSVNWLRLGRKFPLSLNRERGGVRVWSLTNQTLSFLAKKLHPAVVTVHDIIELLEPQHKNSYWLNKYLYRGTPKADHIIAVSHYTAKTIQDYYGIPTEKITIIPNGVGPEFHPIENFRQSIAYQTLRQKLKISPMATVILYIGSDHPRKNVTGAVQAFARLATKQPNTIFVKVGEPGIASGRAAVLEEIDKLDMRDKVRFIGNVSLDRLNELYNLATVLIYPSRFEGFGLPPLQAMAAGTPVLTSNATSLPEVVGEAGIMHDPEDISAFTASLEQLINDQSLRYRLITAGHQRAKQFSWETAVTQELAVYHEVTS